MEVQSLTPASLSHFKSLQLAAPTITEKSYTRISGNMIKA